MGVNRKAIKSMFERNKWRILRGDTVMVVAGPDKHQTGVVTKVIRDKKVPRVLVEGLNLVRAQTGPHSPHEHGCLPVHLLSTSTALKVLWVSRTSGISSAVGITQAASLASRSAP